MDGEADDGEEGGNEHEVNLEPEELAEEGEGTEHDHDVMDEGDDGGGGVAERLRHG